MRAAKSMLRKAVQYLSTEETYPTAFREFKDVLNRVEGAFTTVQGFEHQVFCKQTEIHFLQFRTFSTFRKLLFSSEYFTINNEN